MRDFHAQQVASKIKRDGGDTTSTHGQTLPHSGYLVSDKGGTEIKLEEFTWRDVKAFADSHAFDLAHHGAFLGGWISDGIVYLDVTRHYATQALALEVAAQNDQLAIWDIANNAEIAA